MPSPFPCSADTFRVTLTRESTSVAASALSNLEAAADHCEGLLLCRLESNARGAASRVNGEVSTVITTLQLCVRTAVYHARHHARAVDKLLEANVDELEDTAKLISLLFQQCAACADLSELSKDSHRALSLILEATTGITPVSTTLAPARADAVSFIPESSRFVICIDAARCTVSHPRWLARDGCTAVSIALVDTIGEPVLGVTLLDVACAVDEGSVGWSVAPVEVELNTVTLSVTLSAECSEAAVLRVRVWDTAFTIPLQVCFVLSIFVF